MALPKVFSQLPPGVSALTDIYAKENGVTGVTEKITLAQQVGAAAALGPVVTVSAKGIANGLSTTLNDGKQFGPDTVGTTTCGIQEAISSLPTTTMATAFAGGGTVLLGYGIFSCSGQITIPNTGAFNLRLEGTGKVATLVKYTGVATTFINTAVDTVVSAPGNCSLNITIRSIGFTHVNSTNPTILIRLGALNELDMDGCLLCPESAILSAGGAGLNYTPGGAANKTVGLYTLGDNMSRIRNCSFWRCARGWANYSAHSRCENTIFDGCADAISNYGFELDPGLNTTIPKSYGLLVTSGDCVVFGCHFDGCTVPILSSQSVTQNLYPVFESCIYTSVVDGANGGTLHVYHPNAFMDSGFTAIDKQIDGAGTITNSTNGSIVNLTDIPFGYSTPAAISVGVGGVTVFSVTNAGAVTIGAGAPIVKVLTATAALDFPSTNAQLSADLTIAVAGAALGDVVSLGVPNASILANCSFSAWVSAANTVTVRLNNYSSSAKDPASGTFRVMVTQF